MSSTTTTAPAGAGQRLAERLGLKIIGTEGHDLKCGCISCDSSDAGRIHQDKGLYNCYSCGKALSPWDLCKVVLRDHEAAKKMMIEVGLFEDFFRPASNGTASHATPKPADAVDIIDQVARRKGTTAAGFLAYGATAKDGKVTFPTYRLSAGGAEECSNFYIDASNLNDKGLNAKGKPAGCFLPKCGRPAAGESWIITEGPKNPAAYHTLGYKAVGLNGKHVKKDFLADFVAAFEGVDVTLVPDGDTGSVSAFEELGRALGDTAKSVRIARLPVELKENGGQDVRDVLRQYGEEGPAVVRKAIDEAKPVDADEPPRFTNVITTRDFLLMDLRHTYLIDGVTVQGQQGAIGGRSKCCKTMVALDMALSVASGTPFLGHFKVPAAAPVCFLSYESGGATLQRTFARMAKARGLTPDQTAALPIYWQFEDRICLSDASHIDAAAELVKRLGIQLFIDDPLFLTLFAPGDVPKSGDLFFMGQRLAGLGDLCRSTGVAAYVLHHFRKSAMQDNEEPAGLEELSMSGLGEFVRQWVLLQRRQPYANDGRHDLWARIGGSAGHAGLYGLSIDEGHHDGTWQTEVQRVADAKAEMKQQRENRKAADLEKREGEHRRRLLEALAQFPAGESQRAIRLAAGLNSDNFGKAILLLLKEGRAEPCEVVKGNRKCEGYRPCKG